MSISDEEFQRFQNQLVELKIRIHQLEEQNKRLTAGQFFFLFLKIIFIILENVQLKTQIENFEKDSISLRFPTKVVS
jgi:hypothetical protein